MTTQIELIKKYRKISKNKANVSLGYRNACIDFIKDLQSLQPTTEERVVVVPKDVYDKMVGECTLAAIRRGDFIDKPTEERCKCHFIVERKEGPLGTPQKTGRVICYKCGQILNKDSEIVIQLNK